MAPRQTSECLPAKSDVASSFWLSFGRGPKLQLLAGSADIFDTSNQQELHDEAAKSASLACSVLLIVALQSPSQAPPSNQAPPPPQPLEALTGFDNQSNGFSDADRRKADQGVFEEVEQTAPDGLGPLYNAQSCRECHQTPVSGAASQVSELRVGHLDNHGFFQNPEIPVNHGAQVIKDRTLVNDRAICAEIQEHAPASETIRTFRLTTNVLGDGYVEAIPDATLLNVRKQQCRQSHGRICGQA